VAATPLLAAGGDFFGSLGAVTGAAGGVFCRFLSFGFDGNVAAALIFARLALISAAFLARNASFGSITGLPPRCLAGVSALGAPLL
jgi:hypothetical protein